MAEAFLDLLQDEEAKKKIIDRLENLKKKGEKELVFTSSSLGYYHFKDGTSFLYSPARDELCLETQSPSYALGEKIANLLNEICEVYLPTKNGKKELNFKSNEGDGGLQIYLVDKYSFSHDGSTIWEKDLGDPEEWPDAEEATSEDIYFIYSNETIADIIKEILTDLKKEHPKLKIKIKGKDLKSVLKKLLPTTVAFPIDEVIKNINDAKMYDYVNILSDSKENGEQLVYSPFLKKVLKVWGIEENCYGGEIDNKGKITNFSFVPTKAEEGIATNDKVKELILANLDSAKFISPSTLEIDINNEEKKEINLIEIFLPFEVYINFKGEKLLDEEEKYPVQKGAYIENYPEIKERIKEVIKNNEIRYSENFEVLAKDEKEGIYLLEGKVTGLKYISDNPYVRPYHIHIFTKEDLNNPKVAQLALRHFLLQ